jgi:TorA maturation chaperone TorD
MAAVKQDEMLSRLGETSSLEESKELRVSLQLARGRLYDTFARAFSYPWNRKFFRPKLLLEPLDIVLVDENDWVTAKKIVDGFGNYLPKMAMKQVQSEMIRVFGHAVSQECPPYEMQYGTEGGVQSQTDVLIQVGGFYDTFGFQPPDKGVARDRIDHISIELQFMSFVCNREAYAIENSHDERDITVLRSGQKKFVRNHLGRWLPLFSIFTMRKAEGGLYKDLSELLALFIKNESTLLDVKPIKVEEPEYRSLSYSMENDLIANAPAECEPVK